MRIAVVDVAAIPRHEYRGIEFESEHSWSMEDHWSDAYRKKESRLQMEKNDEFLFTHFDIILGWKWEAWLIDKGVKDRIGGVLVDINIFPQLKWKL